MTDEHRTTITTTASRPFGFWNAWALVVGCTIGSGILMMPTLLAPYGLLGMMGWLVSGGSIMLIALTFARLSRRLPQLGGPYTYARAGLGGFAGFLVAWGYWICLWSGVAAIAVACVGYIGYFIPAVANTPILSVGTGIALIWGLTLVNIRSLEGAGNLQLITTILKLAPMLLIVVVGIGFSSDAVAPPFNPSGGSIISVLAGSAMLTMWALVGVEMVTVPAEAIQNPGATIPRALIIGTLTVLAVYLSSTAAVMFLTPPEVLLKSTAPYADAAMRLIGPVGASLVAIGAIVSTLGALNGNILVAGQTLVAPAREGLMPSIFARSNRQGTPVAGLLIAAILSSILMVMNYTKGLVAAFNFMILLSTLMTLIPYAFASAAELWFLKQEYQGGDRSQRVIRTLGVGLFTFVVTLFIIAGAGQETVFWGFLLLLAGMPVYAFVRKAPAE